MRDGSEDTRVRLGMMLDDWSETGEIGRLEELGRALAALPDKGWPFFPRVMRMLALTPSAERAAAAVRVVVDGDLTESEVRHWAEELADAQKAKVLSRLLADLPAGERATELGACLAHEMIVRQKPVAPVAEELTRRLAGHPLADLPLHPLPGEARLPVDHTDKGDPITLAGTVPVVSRQDTPPDTTAAVIGLVTHSAGRAEGALFTLASPLDPDEVGVRTLEALELGCLAGGGLLLWRADLDDVVAALFPSAAYGGAYLGGAYGRAATWRSMAALSGGSPEGCSWWTFTAVNSWFYRNGQDVGVVCLRPDGHVMAVLAATDSD